jgi:hypothetical protein
MAGISKQQVAIYCKYLGNLDTLLQTATRDEQSLVDIGTWHKIDALRHAFVLHERGLLGIDNERRLRTALRCLSIDDESFDKLSEVFARPL